MGKKALILSGGGARGAYQAGVFRYLEEMGFVPDIVCGTSVGAINACGIASGMDSEKLSELWRTLDRKKVMKTGFRRTFRSLFRRKFHPMADPGPLRELVQSHLDFNALHTSPMDVYIAAVNIEQSKLVFFKNKEISIDHLMASSAIPLLFPWQILGGEAYWDGGLMANTPILPAIQSGADDIISVLLSPVGGEANRQELPKNRREALSRAVELSLLGSYQNLWMKVEENQKQETELGFLSSLLRAANPKIRIRTLGPKTYFSLKSVLNFTAQQAESLIEQGYLDAQNQLKA
ncbi:MAG: patatin-like phospholipase family protein [Leptospiraceae bacterium]|nr:patatin-like phospholipase family protein [Leptospiraceae bacterium]MCP5502327.1 patatin-like phospholipase family protein [Leptospiraceae bacterium]